MRLPEVEEVAGLSGRLWDISRPVLQVCKLVCPEKMADLSSALLEIAGQRIEDRRASIEGQIISILKSLSPEDMADWEVRTSEVLDRLNEGRAEGNKLTSQYLGRKLKAIGIKTRISHGHSIIRIDREEFETLLSQYEVSEVAASPQTSPNSPNSPHLRIPSIPEGESTGESHRISPKLTDSHQSQAADTVGTGEYGESGESLRGAWEDDSSQYAFVESCPHKTPPEGHCRRYTMKLYEPSMSLKPYCKEHRKWCYELTPRPF